MTPDICLVLHLDQPRGYSHFVRIPPHASFQHVPHAQFVSDFVELIVVLFVVHHRSPRYHAHMLRVKAPKLRDHFFELLNAFLPGADVEFANIDRKTWQVNVTTNGAQISIDQISQGMSSILGWVQIVRGSAGELAARYAQADPKGEIVVVVGGAADVARELGDAVAALERLVAAGAKPRPAAAVVAELTGTSANALYRALTESER